MSRRARLCILLILRGRRDAFLAVIAVRCSSFVLASRGSTKRSELTPMGFEEYEKVSVANLLASRQGWCTMFLILFRQASGSGFQFCYAYTTLPPSLPPSLARSPCLWSSFLRCICMSLTFLYLVEVFCKLVLRMFVEP